MISCEKQQGDSIFVTVSDIGLNHIKNHIPNQDAASFFIMDNDFVLAVSDGVGSCLKAEVGSKLAITATTTVFSCLKERGLVPNIQNTVVQIISEWKSMLKGERINDYCATLKGAMKIGNRLLLFSIGDGFLVFSSGDTKISVPFDNELFVNQTVCLNEHVTESDFWTAELVLDELVSYVVFVCTDGVFNGIQEGKEIELAHEIETNTSLGSLKNDLEMFVSMLSEFSSDDRTLGVVKYEKNNAKSDRRNNSNC